MLIHRNRRNAMRTGFTNQKCPKCGGNIFVGRECYFEGNFIVWFEQENCLQCGYICYPKPDNASMEEFQVTKATKELVTV